MITNKEIDRSDLDQQQGYTVVEFGADWCEYCQAAQPLIAEALSGYPMVGHIKIADGKGQRLGRSYTVKRWPTLIFLWNGLEISRLVRPDDVDAITRALQQLVLAKP